MKLNIITITYLFVRLIPVIVLFYFVFQYFITYDINTLFFLLGLFVSFIFIILFSKTKTVQTYQTMDMSSKTPLYCNTFLLLKGMPLSGLPLSQAMFGYMYFFIIYILLKYGLVNQNIQYLVVFPIFIFIDLYWNFTNECTNISLFIISLILGGLLGYGFAFLIDKSPMTNLSQFQKLDKSKDNCFFNMRTNTYKCFENPDILQP